MTELYRCKVIENFQGKHIMNNITNIAPHTSMLSDSYLYRGRQSLKISTGIGGHIILDTNDFIIGDFSVLSVLAMGGAGDTITFRFKIGGTYLPADGLILTLSQPNVWERMSIPLNLSGLSNVTDIKISISNAATVYLQEIVFLNLFHSIIFPQGISAHEESWGMRFSRKQIPVAYGGILQTTGAKGREFSISGMLHEKEQNTDGVIQPMRRLNKEIPYYLVDESGWNNNIWYPVSITDFDIRKIPSAPYLWKFAIDMEEYTEIDI